MAGSIVQSAFNEALAAATTIATGSFGSNVTANNWLWILCNGDVADTTTITQNSGTATIGSVTQQSSSIGPGPGILEEWTSLTCQITGTGSLDLLCTFGGSRSNRQILAFEISGVTGVDSGGGTSQTDGGSNPTPTLTINVANQPSFCLAACVDYQGGTPGVGTGFTSAGTFGATVHLIRAQTKAVTATGNTTGNFVNGSLDVNNAAMIVFNEPSPPVITVQPVQQTVASGAAATFSVTATGATSYQWQVNSSGTWANVSTGSGGTTSSYTTGTLGTSDIGSLFRCQVTNTAGTVNTAEVFVFLTNQPSAGKGERGFGSAWARRTTRRTGNIRSRTVGFIRTRANRTPSKDNSALTSVWFNWFFPAATSTTPNGTLAKTNLNDTSAGQATTTIVSSLARTNTNDTSAVSVTTTVLSTLARTNQNDTSAATGNTWPSSTLAKTNANDTLAASGSVGAAVTSTLAVTNANDTSAVQVTTTIVSSLARTNQNDTSAASVDTTVVTSLARTNVDDTSSGVGTTTILSTLAVTNGNDTINASGSVGSAVSSSLAVTNANDTLSSTGSTTILSTLTFTNQNDTSSISGTTSPNATLSKTNGDDTLVASGTSGFPAAGIGTKLPLTGVGG